MKDYKRIYDLFCRCYEGVFCTEKQAGEILQKEENILFCREKEGKLIGAAVVYQNTVLLLCVLPGERRKGIGSLLLKQAEEHIRNQGYNACKLCEAGIYLTPGAPMYPGNAEFFEKRGYRHSWGSEECVDMILEIQNFRDREASVGCARNGIIYRLAETADREKVVACVRDALSEFAVFYEPEQLYNQGAGERVLLAENGEEICGAVLVDFSGEIPGMGRLSCTSVRPAYARRGIATDMVRIGTAMLKEAGMRSSFIGYTYTGIVPLYARSGYHISMKYFMGKKNF